MNFGELQVLILDDEAMKAATNAQVKEAINSVIAFYARKTFFFNMIKTSFPVQIGTEYYATDGTIDFADIFSILSVTFRYTVVAENFVNLLHSHADENLEKLPTDTVNYPYAYSYAQMQLRVYPAPIIDGLITMLLTLRVDKLLTNTETNNFIKYANELIVQGSKRYLAYNVFNDKELTDKHAALEATELASLVSETKNKLTGRVAPAELVN